MNRLSVWGKGDINLAVNFRFHVAWQFKSRFQEYTWIISAWHVLDIDTQPTQISAQEAVTNAHIGWSTSLKEHQATTYAFAFSTREDGQSFVSTMKSNYPAFSGMAEFEQHVRPEGWWTGVRTRPFTKQPAQMASKQLSVSSNEFASSKSKQPRDPVPSNTPRYSFGVVTRHLRLARSVVCEIACVAGVKRGKGREDLGAWSRALIPFLFPFVRLPRKPFAKAPSKGARDACLTT